MLIPSFFCVGSLQICSGSLSRNDIAAAVKKALAGLFYVNGGECEIRENFLRAARNSSERFWEP